MGNLWVCGGIRFIMEYLNSGKKIISCKSIRGTSQQNDPPCDSCLSIFFFLIQVTLLCFSKSHHRIIPTFRINSNAHFFSHLNYTQEDRQTSLVGSSHMEGGSHLVRLVPTSFTSVSNHSSCGPQLTFFILYLC